MALFEYVLLDGSKVIELGIVYGLRENRPVERVARNLFKVFMPLQIVCRPRIACNRVTITLNVLIGRRE